MEALHRGLLVEALNTARALELGLPVAAGASMSNGPDLTDRLLNELGQRGLAIVDANVAEFAKAINEQAARPNIEVLWVVLPVTRKVLTDAHNAREYVADQIAKTARAQALKRIDEART